MDPRKALVRDAYDAVADSWGEERRARGQDERERGYVERFCAALPASARVLDLGCGSGAPILVELVRRGYQVTGVDLSQAQVAQARARCPNATVLQGDLAGVQFDPASFDGVIAYDSIWHVPREEHQRVFEDICSWLVPRGTALLTLGAAVDSKGELLTELKGAPVFYAAWPEETSLEMLAQAGLSVVTHDRRAGHLSVLAEKL